MKKYVLLIILFSPAIFGHDRPKLIGKVEFFGHSGIDFNVGHGVSTHQKEE
jgi:hypothetical protein